MTIGSTMIINRTHRSILMSFEMVFLLFRAGFPGILSAAVDEVSDYLYKEITKKVFLYPSSSEGAVEGRLSFHSIL